MCIPIWDFNAPLTGETMSRLGWLDDLTVRAEWVRVELGEHELKLSLCGAGQVTRRDEPGEEEGEEEECEEGEEGEGEDGGLSGFGLWFRGLGWGGGEIGVNIEVKSCRVHYQE